MKKVKLKQLIAGTQFRISKDECKAVIFTARGSFSCNLKGGLLRLCTRNITGSAYTISANRFVFVDDDTAVIE